MSISSFGMGFVVGYGSGFFTREALPFAREIFRPISKVLIRVTVKALEQTREGISRLGETVEDVVAEVRHELKKDKHRKRRARVKTIEAGVERTA